MVYEIPKTMKAWVVTRRGTPQAALALKRDYPVPKPGPGQVLVKVQAAALNPIGWKLMKTLPTVISGRPLIAENDFSGIIVDSNGTQYQEGDAVFGMVPVEKQMKSKQGSLAEYMTVSIETIAHRPANLSATDAAGFTLAGLTAYRALVKDGQLESGQRVFINGGSSSVGAFAIQIAKAKGAHVSASASGGNENFVRSLGADEFFDYTKAPIHKQLVDSAPSPKFHILLDAVGLADPSLFTFSETYLAPGCIFLSTGPMPKGWSDITKLLHTLFSMTWPAFLGGVNRKYKVVTGIHDDEAWLKDYAHLIAEGKVKPVVDSVFGFKDVLDAYERIMTGRAKGKVVVTID